MPARNLSPSTLDDVYLAWGCAEAAAPWRVARQQQFPADLVERIERGRLTRADELEVIARVRQGRRGDETRLFHSLDIAWRGAEFPIPELGDVVLHPHWASRIWEAAPPRTVRAFEARPGKPSEFDLSRAPDPDGGLPLIFVAVHETATPRIVEGNHRAVAVWHFHMRGDARFQNGVRIILGVHPGVEAWVDYEK